MIWGGITPAEVTWAEWLTSTGMLVLFGSMVGIIVIYAVLLIMGGLGVDPDEWK